MAGFVIDELLDRLPIEPSVDAFRVELAVKCDGCDVHVPVNELCRSVSCSGCSSEIELSTKTWMQLIDALPGMLTRLGPGTSEHGKLEAPGLSLQWERAATDVPCPSCSGPLELREEALALGCPACGGSRDIGLPPRWITPVARNLVGFVTDTDEPGTPRTKQPWWLLLRVWDPRRGTPDVRRMGCSCGAFLVAGVAVHAGAIALVVNDIVSLWTVLAAYAAAAAISVVVWLRRQAFLGPLVRREHEVVARLGDYVDTGFWGFRDNYAMAEVLDPADPDHVLATTRVPIKRESYAAFGGTGALVRAWHRNGKTFATAQLSALRLRASPRREPGYRG